MTSNDTRDKHKMGDLREAFSDGEQRGDDSLLFNVPATHIVLNGLHVKHQVFQSC